MTSTSKDIRVTRKTSTLQDSKHAQMLIDQPPANIGGLGLLQYSFWKQMNIGKFTSTPPNGLTSDSKTKSKEQDKSAKDT